MEEELNCIGCICVVGGWLSICDAVEVYHHPATDTGHNKGLTEANCMKG